MQDDAPVPAVAAAGAAEAGGAGLAAAAEQGSGEQQPKRAKRGEEEGDAMVVDDAAPAGGVPSTEVDAAQRKETLEERRRRELEAYFATVAEKPHAPDLSTFLGSPLQYSPQSPCLLGTVDAENNTALILAIKNTAEKAFFILARGKDPAYINAQNSKGVTALNIASHRCVHACMDGCVDGWMHARLPGIESSWTDRLSAPIDPVPSQTTDHSSPFCSIQGLREAGAGAAGELQGGREHPQHQRLHLAHPGLALRPRGGRAPAAAAWGQRGPAQPQG